MANYTAYHVSGTGLDIYAKPLPLTLSPWSTGVVAFTEAGSTGVYSATLDDSLGYIIFVRAGLNPTDTDAVDGSLDLGVFPTLVENVSGWRFTSKALEQAPTLVVDVPGFTEPFQVELTKPVRMTAGDTKKTADGNALQFPVRLPQAFDPSGATITFAAERRPRGLGAQDFISSTDCAFTVIDGADFVAVEFLASADTDKRPGEYDWNVVVTKGTSEITKTRGVLVLLPKFLPPPPPA